MRLHRDVYEPAEDTRLILRVLAEREPDLVGARAVDVGTGTGVVAQALARGGARTLALDLSPVAVDVARSNLEESVDLVRADLLGPVRGPFDVVTFNAPYLPSAPEERVEGWLDHAFHGGEGGIEVSARFIADLPRVLAPWGRAYLVVSSRADLDGLRRRVDEALLDAQVVASERFFFEEIAVWRLARKHEALPQVARPQAGRTKPPPAGPKP